MYDFVVITEVAQKNVLIIKPKFVIKKSKDLMIRGGDFYAVWDEKNGIWSEDEETAVNQIDSDLRAYKDQKIASGYEGPIQVLYLWDAETGLIDKFHKYCQSQMRDSYHPLDEKLIFANDPIRKEDYASKRLSYPLTPGDISGYEKLISTLYEPEERQKLEWAIGSIVAGDSGRIQKFIVLYGAMGTGKSTILNIIQLLFSGYYCVFSAKDLGSASSSFALEAFRSNPLVAIQHDGDLSRIEDNTRLNSLVSHEEMVVNEKFKSSYSNRFRCFLFLGTNRPVKITDAKSGIIRRLIDVHPSGKKLPKDEYDQCMGLIPFELGAIACHCKDVYESNKSLYDSYVPYAMLDATNDFYNFMLENYITFKNEDEVRVNTAWKMYKEYCEEAKVNYPYSKRIFTEELKNYFETFETEVSKNSKSSKQILKGFKANKFNIHYENESEKTTGEEKSKNTWLTFDSETSLFDEEYSSMPAQYANEDGTPCKKWENVKTTLKDLDTKKLHYVQVPMNHIVIDFDIPNVNGEKDFDLNFEEAKKWPKTYAELSKSGKGIHLHYIYTGDPTKLSRIYDDKIEVKVFTGNSSLRRKLTKCNSLPIATISSGLPLKGDEKEMVNWEGIKNEKMLRTIIRRNLNKEYSPYTKPSVDYIFNALEDAYKRGIPYDVSDLRNSILIFAANSSHQAQKAIELVGKMHFKSETETENKEFESPIVFFDVEVFKNLFVVCWKKRGEKAVIKWINPSSKQIEELLNYRLVGFNNRKYDNHIIYARLLGYTNYQLYSLSQALVSDDKRVTHGFGEAYNLSYTDIYDFAAKKQSLKKWEIELKIHHKELAIPWDEEVPENRFEEVASYCANDVEATEAVFEHLQGDFLAREILADLAGMTVNDTTNTLTTRIIFSHEKHPKLVYTDLATGKASDAAWENHDTINAFPGYSYERGEDGKMHNMFRGVDLGKGGYVYAEPGTYYNVALLDVASLHPHSMKALNIFGEYTQRFVDLMDIRIHIKHGEYDIVRKMFDGKLAKYLTDETSAKQLSQALKIAINSVYGLTSAKFDNPFRDPRNENNIVALRGALFMKTLQDEVEKLGFTVAHIKTDSIKIPNATPEIIQFCMDFARQYGYEFEHEATYAKMCLVNDAVYIAKYDEGHGGEWTATGTQFQIPYVFKALFSKEPIVFDDICVTNSVTTALYLDMNETLAEGEHDYRFIGRVGQFCPIKSGFGGGVLVRKNVNKLTGAVKYDSVSGSKGYRFLESEDVRGTDAEEHVDIRYFDALIEAAIDTINQYCDFYSFSENENLRSAYQTENAFSVR